MRALKTRRPTVDLGDAVRSVERLQVAPNGRRHREEVHAGTEAYALCYEMADLEKAVAGDDSKRELLGYASDVMELMTKLRTDWGVVYPEEE